MKQKCLIIGSCGFLLSNFIRNAIYNKSEFEFISIDKVIEPTTLHNIYANKGHKFYIGDVCDEHFVNTIFDLERPDIVIHGAEIKNNDCLINNIQSTQVLLKISKKFDIKKFIYLSTTDFYQTQSIPSEDFNLESSVLKPNNIYEVSKISSELLVQTSGLKYNILRCCNSFGPRQINNFDSLIPIIIGNIINDKQVTLNDQGRRVRDWLHIEDQCSAILNVIANGSDDTIYNISAGHEISDLEIFHEISKFFNKGYELLTSVETDTGSYRKCSNSKLLKNMGWKPSLKLKQAITQTCSWYQNNLWYLKMT